jgi:hypothetical protein
MSQRRRKSAATGNDRIGVIFRRTRCEGLVSTEPWPNTLSPQVCVEYFKPKHKHNRKCITGSRYEGTTFRQDVLSFTRGHLFDDSDSSKVEVNCGADYESSPVWHREPATFKVAVRRNQGLRDAHPQARNPRGIAAEVEPGVRCDVVVPIKL